MLLPGSGSSPLPLLGRSFRVPPPILTGLMVHWEELQNRLLGIQEAGPRQGTEKFRLAVRRFCGTCEVVYGLGHWHWSTRQRDQVLREDHGQLTEICSDCCCALQPSEQVCGFLLKLLCACDHTQGAPQSSCDTGAHLCLLSA